MSSFKSAVAALALLPVVYSQDSSLVNYVTSSQVASYTKYSSINSTAPFQVYDRRFDDIIGPNPTFDTIVANDVEARFHEAGIWLDSPEPMFFVTSNQINTTEPSPESNNKTVYIGKVSQANNGTWIYETIEPSGPVDIVLANGGYAYKDGVIFTAQGDLNTNGAIVYMNASSPYNTYALIDSYYGIPFNSLNDAHVTSDGAIWFTDPPYGYSQDIRPAPQLPAQTYRYDPSTGSIRVVADGLGHPNGITFSPDESICYITDGSGTDNATQTLARTIYAYDVQNINGGVFLANKRVFALPEEGIVDGIKVDMKGNVYGGCGDGVNVWSAGGELLGKVKVEEGAANFVLGPEGELFLFSEENLYLAMLANSTVGAAAV